MITISTPTTKVMSLSSTSGAPTPPNATPCTDSSGVPNDGLQADLDAIGRILGPIQEELNEQAEVAMLPSPPINTPEAFSPAPSVYRPARNRGFSLLGDRLAALKLHERPRRGSDAASSSRSVVTSPDEEDRESTEDDASSVGARSTGVMSTPRFARNKNSQSLISPTPAAIPVALGSARFNPRIDEYVHFSSKDLPVAGPVKGATSSLQAVPANDGSHARGSSFESMVTYHNGVTEKTTWAEEVEDAAERAFLRLEQLACDEAVVNPQYDMGEIYTERLQRLLASDNRKVKIKVSIDVGRSVSSSMTELVTERPAEDLNTSATSAMSKDAAKE